MTPIWSRWWRSWMSTLHDMGEQVRNVIFKKFRRLIWYFQDIVSITKCSKKIWFYFGLLFQEASRRGLNIESPAGVNKFRELWQTFLLLCIVWHGLGGEWEAWCVSGAHGQDIQADQDSVFLREVWGDSGGCTENRTTWRFMRGKSSCRCEECDSKFNSNYQKIQH